MPLFYQTRSKLAAQYFWGQVVDYNKTSAILTIYPEKIVFNHANVGKRKCGGG